MRVYNILIESDLASLCFLFYMLAVLPYKPVYT